MTDQQIIDLFDSTNCTLAELSARSGHSVAQLKAILNAGMNADCVICAETIQPQANGWTHGHNAAPLYEGQCCNDCWVQHVLPERLHAG